MKRTRSLTVPVAELKAKLSEYLRVVKAGGVVTITDRGRPVAELTGVRAEAGAAARVEELVATGLARAPKAKRLPANFWKRPRAHDPEGHVLDALLEERRTGR